MSKSSVFTTSVIKICMVVPLMSTAAANAIAGDSERINQLERDVQELKLRLSNLENARGVANGRQKPEPVSTGWKSLANWRSLKQGMSFEAVRAILGEPDRISGGDFTHWSYPNFAEVVFYRDKLDHWREPR